MSWSQRPFTKTGMVISDAFSTATSATVNVITAVPPATERLGTSLRSSIPGIPAVGSINPIPAISVNVSARMPSMPDMPDMPEIPLVTANLPNMPSMPALPKVSMPGLPSVPLPQVQLPQVKVPELAMPRISVGLPSNFGVPYGDFFGLEDGKTLLPDFKVRFGADAEQLEQEEEIRDLSKALDLERLKVEFVKYAGPDEQMDEEEFKLFAKKMKMSERIQEMLWRMFDVDGNGIVDADEFTDGLANLQAARAWLRFCPTCDFDNSCDYCVEVGRTCNDCNRERWCPKCWADHPDGGEHVPYGYAGAPEGGQFDV